MTASAGIGPNKLVAKIASEINKPNGQYEVKPEKVPEFMEPLPVRKLWGIGAVAEEKLAQAGVTTCGEMQRLSRPELHELFGKFGSELYDLCRGIDDRPVEPNRERKSLSTEETFSSDLTTLEQCEEKVGELFEELAAELAQKEPTRRITKIFVKLKFSDFTRTTIERAGLLPNLGNYRQLLEEAFCPDRQEDSLNWYRRSLRRDRTGSRPATVVDLSVDSLPKTLFAGFGGRAPRAIIRPGRALPASQVGL